MKYLKKLIIDNNSLNKIINKIKNIEIKQIEISNLEDFSLFQNKDFIIKSKVVNFSYLLLSRNKNDMFENDIKKLEDIISEDSKFSYFYARDVIKGPWGRGEESISKSSEWSYWYASDIIKGRWIKVQNILIIMQTM